MTQNQQSQISMIKYHQQQPHNPQQSNNLLSQSIQKGQQTRFHYQVVINYDCSLLTFSILNIILSLMYYDADYVGKSNIAITCLRFTDIITIIQILVTFMRYNAKVSLQKSQKILQQQQNIYTSGKIYQILMQIFVLMIQPYSFLDNIKITTYNIYDDFYFEYKINYILIVLGFTKIFIALRVVLMRQLYMTPRSNRLCRMYGSQSNYLYAIKCLFKDSPLTLIGIVFATSIVLFSVSLRIAQRNLVIEYPKHFDGKPYPGNIEKFQNAIWLTIITMTTVGYGDFFPRTLFGRAIDVLLVIWGTFIVSLMVVVLTNTLNMDQAQKRALIVLNRLEAKKGLKDAAAFLITHTCRKYLIQKKIAQKVRPPLTESQKNSLDRSFYKYLSNFQNVHRSIRSMYEIDDVYQEMTRQFEVINDQVKLLLTSQQETILNLKQQKTETNDDKNHKNQSLHALSLKRMV